MIINNDIGKRLVELRKYLNLNQTQLAKILGFSSGNGLSMIEKGNTPIQESYIKILELTYFVNRDWLLTGIGEMLLDRPVKQYQNLDEEPPTIIEEKAQDLSKTDFSNTLDIIKLQRSVMGYLSRSFHRHCGFL